MPTTPQERLFVVYEAYSRAYERRSQDWKEAKSKAQADAVFKNVERLEGLYLKAAKQALDANSAAVENAYTAAKAAQKVINDAYEEAKSLAEKIKLIGGVISKVGDLITTASGK